MINVERVRDELAWRVAARKVVDGEVLSNALAWCAPTVVSTHAYRFNALPGERAITFALRNHRPFCLIFCLVA